MKFSSIVKSGASALLVAAFCLPLQTNAAAPTELQSYVVGSLAGRFSVEQGAANYSVPIAVPPGVAGVQPELAFSYSSSGGNGTLGVGWSLSGLSAITRCGRTLVQDGQLGTVEWKRSDRYCLDGQRLVLVSGTYGEDGSEYRTETDGFTRIRAHGQAGEGPASFSVQTKAGLTVEYGNTADSSAKAQGRSEVQAWSQNKITDAVGNSMAMIYVEDPQTGQQMIDRIEYAANIVQFIYEPASRVQMYHLSGTAKGLSNRLSKVEVRAEGSLISDYRLAYEEVGASILQLLTSITQCLADGPCLSPTIFLWDGENSNTIVNRQIWHSDTAPNFNGDWHQAFVDMTGDGLPDFVQHYQGSSGSRVWVYENTAAGFKDRVIWDHDTAPNFNSDWHQQFVDMTGDGLPDYVRHYQGSSGSRVWVGINTGSGFETRKIWHSDTAPNFNSDWHQAFVDMTGDGLPDFVQHYQGSSGSRVWVYENTAAGFKDRVIWDHDTAPNFNSDWHQQFVDMTGDGLPDYVRHYQGSSGSRVWVGINTGSGFETRKIWHSDTAPNFNSDWHQAFADMTGDGLPDFVQHYQGSSGSRVWVYENTAAGFKDRVIWDHDTTPKFNGDWHQQFVDMTGDGLPDHVRHYQGSSGERVWVGVNTGSGFETRAIWRSDTVPNFNSDWHQAFVDMTGDGLSDFVQHYQGKSGGRVWVHSNIGGVSRHITEFKDSLGAKIAVRYDALTTKGFYVKGEGGVHPTPNLQMPMWVVSDVEKSNGLGGTTSTGYRYGGLRAHVQGRGLLGFAWDEATDESTGVTTRTEYHQDYPFTGMPKAVTTYAADGTVLSSTTTTYEDLYAVHPETRPDGSVWDYETHFPYLVEKVEKSYELDGTLVSTAITRQSNYDAYGNVGTVEVITEAGGETFSKVTTSNYDNIVTADKWHLGRLRDATVVHTHSNGSTETRKSAFTYYAETGLLKDEIIEPDQPAYRQVTTYEYDAFGNKVRVAVSADGLPTRISTSGYDPSGRFATSVQNALGHAEARTFDHATGKALSLTGPNNLTTRWEYDGLARVERELRADGTETLTTRTWVDASDAHAPVAAYYKVTEEISGSAPASVYYDQLGRVIRKLSTGFDGKAIYQDTEYDEQGREYRSSLPYFVDDPAYWVINHYDEVNRVVKKSFDTGKGTVVTQIDYQGLTTVETNTLGQVKRTTKNALGKVVLVEEEEGGKVTYEYDAIGNLLKTHQHDDASAKVVTTELWYDVRGQKTAMQDPDMGYWTYQHNAFGELVSQTDAKNRSVSMTYDNLGRMIRRVEPEGETVWTYDTAQKGIGKLYKVEQFDTTGTLLYSTEHSYDNFGREIVSVNAFDGKVFNTAVEYDAFGRVAKSWRPNGFETENLYNQYGYLLAKRSPSNHVNDYDAQHLAGLYDDAVTSAQSALDAAADLLDRQAYFLTKAAEYEALGDTAVNLPQDLLDHLQEAAELSHYAAQALSADIDNALTLAEQLIVVAGGLRDRMEQAELWVDASQSETLDAMLADPAYVTWWRATSRDAAGRLTGHRTGNGLVTIQDYDRATGQLNTIQTGFGHGDLIRHLDYEYDALDNVQARRDRIQDAHETFDYDGLNRLVTSTVDGTADGIAYHAETTYVYDALGNMLNKSDVGTYLYGNAAKSVGNAGPHALSHAANDEYIYDDNGSITEGGGRTITWTSFNKPTSFQKDGTVVQFHYGPDRARYKKTVGGMVGFDETTLYLGKSYERVEKSNGEVTHKYFIYADDGLAAIHIEHEDGNGVIDESRDETRYLHRDALGSIDTITDGQGVIVERTGYSPFGERRAGDWRTIGGLNLALYTNRGFTGHEHIDEVGLIHMNGRVYDPQLGRFLSADPHVQAPYSSQSYNRYAYAMNNPLKYTDPSGYFFKKLFKSIKKAFKSIGKFLKKYGRVIVAIAAAAFIGPAAAGALGFTSGTLAFSIAAGAVGGFVSGAILGGSLKAGLKGALFGGISAGLAFDIGHGSIGNWLEGAFDGAVAVARDIAHGIAQGIVSELSGGDFKSGFLGGALGHYAGRRAQHYFGNMEGATGVAARTTVAAVAGGTASTLGGGKFGNGAISAAFSHLFNNEGQSICKGSCHGYDGTPGRSMTKNEQLVLTVSSMVVPGSGFFSAVRSLFNGLRSITLYRAVGPAELLDIQATGQLINRGSAEGKYFTSSAAYASDYARQAVNSFGDPAYTIVSTRVRISSLPTPVSVDGGIPAYVLSNDSLQSLRPEILNYMALPH
ncbi:RHS repeat-associated core domain-containing protein [Thiosocius teredinicola]|uniref:RHS repeat-associated core domain-containing protein n=1 Tax=Thiosocius teredinicola TaxID=1973002 RepID=UPI000990BBFF